MSPPTRDVQGEVVRLLGDPASYGAGVERVERIDTHAASVFLAGERAYKIKRAVRYSFLDFSTLEGRRAACEEELRLNRRTAPEIYLRTLAVTRERDGRLALDGSGEAVEWAVEMRRFAQRDLLRELALRGELTPTIVATLVDEVLAFHAAAEVLGPPYGGAEELWRVIDDNSADFAACPEIFPPARVAAYTAAVEEALRSVAALLDRRRTDGFVRHCHGDLHLGNIVLWRGLPTLFDCIEFNLRLAATDVVYDLAFLLMDLEFRGLRALANLALARYFGRAGAPGVLAALPVMLSLRAAVRAKVSAPAVAAQSDPALAERLRVQSLAYLAAAEGYLAPVPARLLAVGGLSGSGKSTLAGALAPGLGRAPGALHLRSDVLRKRLFGVAPEQPLPAESYTRDVSARVYELLIDEARVALAAGQSVVADAVWSRPEERAAIAAVAGELGLAFTGLWLEAPREVLLARVGGRGADASDATEQVVADQADYELGEITWRRLDAAGDPRDVLAAARDEL